MGAEGMVTNFATDHHPGITIKRSQIVFSILRSAQSSLYPLHPIEKIPETDAVFRLKLTKFPPPSGGGTIHKPKQERFIPHVHALARVPKWAENRIEYVC